MGGRGSSSGRRSATERRNRVDVQAGQLVQGEQSGRFGRLATGEGLVRRGDTVATPRSAEEAREQFARTASRTRAATSPAPATARPARTTAKSSMRPSSFSTDPYRVPSGGQKGTFERKDAREIMRRFISDNSSEIIRITLPNGDKFGVGSNRRIDEILSDIPSNNSFEITSTPTTNMGNKRLMLSVKVTRRRR